MKTIGIIGGISWKATLCYYQLMNQQAQARLGGNHSIEAIIYSVNFEHILHFVKQDKWSELGELFASIAKKLEEAGSEFLIITSNAAHKIFPKIKEAVTIPLLHIIDPLAAAIYDQGLNKIGLLGTTLTMEDGFYQDYLEKVYNIQTLIPEEEERRWLQKMIFDELTKGQVYESSQKKCKKIIQKLSQRGVGGIVLGCTDLNLLVKQNKVSIPLFDTLEIHAKAAIDFALS